MKTIEEQILGLSQAELDAFPLGIIRLDPTGKILYYNRAEEQLARRRAAETLGLNFFRDVAPCTAVKEFQGRFEDFVQRTSGTRIEPFEFLFLFGWGNVRVTITMVRNSAAQESIYIVVNASQVAK